MTTNQELVAAAFVSEDAHKKLGTHMADFVYAQMQKPGRLRTMMFHMSNPTVPEFTDREVKLARRIVDKHGVWLGYRAIIRQLRVAKCNV